MTGSTAPWFALATYAEAEGRERVALVSGEPDDAAYVLPLEVAVAAYQETTGEKLPRVPADISVLRLLQGWASSLPFLRKLAAFVSDQEAAGPLRGQALAQPHLLAPIPWPGKLVNVGLNYYEHAEEMGFTIDPATFVPNFFTKGDRTCIIGPSQAIKASSPYVDWEGELALVVGRKARNVAPEHASDYIAGYTLHNDVTDRRAMARPDGSLDFYGGKSRETFAPLGPWLVPKEFLPDPGHLRIRLLHNGRVMQDMNTSGMMWGAERCLAYLSTISTLLPGDIIALGTGSGTGWTTGAPEPKTVPSIVAHMESGGGVFLRSGDVVTVEAEGIGKLENRVE